MRVNLENIEGVHFSFGANRIRANEFAATTTPSRPTATRGKPTQVGFVLLLQRIYSLGETCPQSEMHPIEGVYFTLGANWASSK